MNITSDDSKRWWEKVDISRIDQETRRSLLLKLKEKYPTSDLLARLGIKSRATLTKYFKYGRRIPDELVALLLYQFLGLAVGTQELFRIYDQYALP